MAGTRAPAQGRLRGGRRVVGQLLGPRPALAPRPTWARVALVLLVAFTLFRGVLWASTQPGWFAPDEDYHWLYIEYVLIEKTLPDLDKPFYTGELYNAVLDAHQGDYYPGPRTVYEGGPRSSLDALKHNAGARDAQGGPPRQVLHPPLYHLPAALVDRAVTGQLAPVRLTAIRYYSAALGALLTYFAWLLAAQVLPRIWHQLAASAVVATQPGLAFAAARVGNDILAAVTFTAVLAWLAWMLKTRPDRRQGYLLGLLLALAVLSKATSLVLVPLAAVALLLIWAVWPASRGEVGRIAVRASAVLLVLTAWWWVWVLAETGSPLGNRGALTGLLPLGPGGGAGALATLHLGVLDVHAAGDWIRDAYRTYWIHQFPYEVHSRGFWYFVPIGAAAVGLAGLGVMTWRHRHSLLSAERPLLRQGLFLVLAPIAITLPFFALDMVRAGQGLPFLTATGRFSLPAAPAAAVVFVLGLRELVPRRRRVGSVLIVLGVALAFANYAVDYARWGVERYYGSLGDLGDTLRHATWDKPDWVTTGFLVALAIAAVASFAGAWVVTGVWGRRDATGA